MVVTRESSYILTAEGVYAIDRTAHAEAVRKVNRLTSDRRVWESQSDELKKKLSTAAEPAREKLNEQIASFEQRIRNADAEEKRLRGSCVRWRYP
ncbi:MAG: hypothetical protein ACYTEK_02175, partial [Planctomycetota bacterium]